MVQTEQQESGLYPMDRDKIEVNIKIGNSKHVYTHTLRKATFDEEEARERKAPLITQDAGKVDGMDASSFDIDEEPANVYLYDKTVIGIRGYALNPEDGASTEDIDPNSTITVNGKEIAVKEAIPASHKNTVINGMYPSNFKVDIGEDDDNEFVFALGGGREWKVVQEVGGKIKQEDGTLSPPDYTINYFFREPTEAERKKYRTQAMIALNLVDPKTKTVKERRSTNLKVIRDLFDKLIQRVEGASYGGKEFNANDAKQVESIPSDFKKMCIIKLFNFLEADLGN